MTNKRPNDEQPYDPNVALNNRAFVEFLDTLTADEWAETNNGRELAAAWRLFLERERSKS